MYIYMTWWHRWFGVWTILLDMFNQVTLCKNSFLLQQILGVRQVKIYRKVFSCYSNLEFPLNCPFIYLWYSMKYIYIYRNLTPEISRTIQMYPDIQFHWPNWPITAITHIDFLAHLRPFRGFSEVHRGGARSSSSDAIRGGVGGPAVSWCRKCLGLL